MRASAAWRRLAATALAALLCGAASRSPAPTASPSPDSSASPGADEEMVIVGTLTRIGAHDAYAYPDVRSLVAAGSQIWVSEGENGRIARANEKGVTSEIALPNGLVAGEMAAAKDGTVWFLDETSEGDTIGRILPGDVSALVHLKKGTHATGLAVASDGNVWFAGSGTGVIGHLNANTGAVRYFDAWPKGFQPADIAIGPDGNLWITDVGRDAIVRMTSSADERATFPIRSPRAHPRGLVVGGDGNLWFGESNSDGLGRISLSGTIKQFKLKSPGGHDPKFEPRPFAIAAAPDGIWIVEESNDFVLRLGYDGKQSNISTTLEARPWDVVRGADGRMWFTENGSTKLARINADNSLAEFEIIAPGNARDGFVPSMVEATATGDLWLADRTRPSVGVLSGSKFEEVALWQKTPDPELAWMAAAADGSVWITERAADVIEHVQKDGSKTTVAIPTRNAKPNDISIGADGTVWVAETGTASVGRIAADESYTEIKLARNDDVPTRVVPDGDGALVLCSERSGNAIERVGNDGSVKVVESLTNDGITNPDLIADGKGTYWRTATVPAGRNSTKGALLRAGADGTKRSAQIAFLGDSDPGLTIAPNGDVWFSIRDATNRGSVGRLSPSGTVQTFRVPSGAQAYSIAPLPNGGAIFVEQPATPSIGAATLGKIDTTNHVTEYAIR